MSELGGDKNYIENLLKALPVEEAIATFNGIDLRIVQLLECSSDDFLSLNDHFKNYHKESKSIAQNANSILQLITDDKVNNLFLTLKKFNEGYDKLTNMFTKHIEELDIEIKKASNKLDNLKLAQSNLKQNLASIRILISGISGFKNNETAEIETISEKIKQLLSITENSIEQFHTISTETFLLLTNIKQDNYLQLQKINDNIESSFLLFSKKYKEASDYYPSLKEHTDKNSANIANIITNLQYHDIIRQKIEHIQRTHKDITTELKSYSNDDNSALLLHSKAKTFLKIRDVAGLQAAQLLHANKQYQVAIEEIGDNLEEIGNEMITISSMCENLVGKTTQTKDYYINNIVSNLNNAQNYNGTLTEFITNIKLKTQALSDKNKGFLSIAKEVYDEKELLKQKISSAISSLNPKQTSENEKSIVEIQSLLHETDHAQEHMAEIYNELNSKVELIVNPKDNFIGETQIVESLNELSLTVPNLVELLKSSIQNIDEFLYSNSNICLNVSDNIKSSINNIKYYDLFEKACDKIIEDLNFINLKLNYGTGLSDETRLHNLKSLKERYTMASEHLIHEHLSQISDLSELTDEKAENLINIVNQNSEADDDNLELF